MGYTTRSTATSQRAHLPKVLELDYQSEPTNRSTFWNDVPIGTCAARRYSLSRDSPTIGWNENSIPKCFVIHSQTTGADYNHFNDELEPAPVWFRGLSRPTPPSSRIPATCRRYSLTKDLPTVGWNNYSIRPAELSPDD